MVSELTERTGSNYGFLEQHGQYDFTRTESIWLPNFSGHAKEADEKYGGFRNTHFCYSGCSYSHFM